MSKQTYLVAVDGSEWSDRAAKRAMLLAEKTEAKVHFVTVIPLTSLLHITPGGSPAMALDKDYFENIAMRDVLEPLKKTYLDAPINMAFDILWGQPVVEIHEMAKKEHASMIFVGRRGRSQIADLFVGSVAHSLAHTAGVPVVLVP